MFGVVAATAASGDAAAATAPGCAAWWRSDEDGVASTTRAWPMLRSIDTSAQSESPPAPLRTGSDTTDDDTGVRMAEASSSSSAPDEDLPLASKHDSSSPLKMATSAVGPGTGEPFGKYKTKPLRVEDHAVEGGFVPGDVCLWRQPVWKDARDRGRPWYGLARGPAPASRGSRIKDKEQSKHTSTNSDSLEDPATQRSSSSSAHAALCSSSSSRVASAVHQASTDEATAAASCPLSPA